MGASGVALVCWLILGSIGVAFGQIVEPAEPQVARVFALKRASTEDTINVLAALFPSGPTTFSSVPGQRMIIANGPASDLTMIEAVVTRLDASPEADPDRPQTISIAPEADSERGGMAMGRGGLAMGGFGTPRPTEIKLFRLQHLDPTNAVTALSPLFPSGPGLGGGRVLHLVPPPTFVAVPSQRTLIVRGPADDLAKIEALLKVLDVPEAGDATEQAPITTPSGASSASVAPLHATGEVAADAPQLPANYRQKRFDLKYISPWNIVTLLESLRQLPGAEWIEMDLNVDQQWINVRASEATLAVVEKLIQAADTRLGQTAFHRPRRGPNDVPVREEQLERLKSASRQADDRAKELARGMGRPESGDPTPAAFAELEAAVAEAFDARQKLQDIEIAALEGRLTSMRTTLTAREKIKDEIVKRRVEELLNPALEWDTTGNGKPSAASDASVATATSDLPTAAVEAGASEGN